VCSVLRGCARFCDLPDLLGPSGGRGGPGVLAVCGAGGEAVSTKLDSYPPMMFQHSGGPRVHSPRGT
jgi:hypothetical protein